MFSLILRSLLIYVFFFKYVFKIDLKFKLILSLHSNFNLVTYRKNCQSYRMYTIMSVRSQYVCDGH